MTASFHNFFVPINQFCCIIFSFCVLYPMLPVSLNCPYLIVLLSFSHHYYPAHIILKCLYQARKIGVMYIYVVCMYYGFRVSLYFSIMVVNSVSCCVFRKRKDIVKQTGVRLMQVELTNISYIETFFKVRFIQGSV